MSIEHPRLFGTGKRKKPPPDPLGKATGELVALFCRLYKARVGEPPNLDKRDPAIVRRKIALLDSTYGSDAPAKVAERLTYYLTHEDEWVRTHGGFTLRNFDLRWDAITNLMQPATSRGFICQQHNPPCPTASAHTRRILADQRDRIDPQPLSPSRPNDAF